MTDVFLYVIAAFLLSYLFAAAPLGLAVVRALTGRDIRRYGTGNIGAANVAEHAGRGAAAVVALGVFLQGLLPPLVAGWLSGSAAVVAAAATGAVAGYAWSVFLGFRGGRALGVGTGAAAALSGVGFLILLGFYVAGALLRQTSLLPFLGFVAYALWMLISGLPVAYFLSALVILGIISAKRLEGVGRDLGRAPFLTVVFSRLLFQRSPGEGD